MGCWGLVIYAMTAATCSGNAQAHTHTHTHTCIVGTHTVTPPHQVVYSLWLQSALIARISHLCIKL